LWVLVQQKWIKYCWTANRNSDIFIFALFHTFPCKPAEKKEEWQILLLGLGSFPFNGQSFLKVFGHLIQPTGTPWTIYSIPSQVSHGAWDPWLQHPTPPHPIHPIPLHPIPEQSWMVQWDSQKCIGQL
jgi:hypothetical protein